MRARAPRWIPSSPRVLGGAVELQEKKSEEREREHDSTRRAERGGEGGEDEEEARHPVSRGSFPPPFPSLIYSLAVVIRSGRRSRGADLRVPPARSGRALTRRPRLILWLGLTALCGGGAG